MGASEFRKLGLLQEINRQFLHPLGLALEVVIEEDGSEHFGQLWDYRDDPEGIGFADLQPLNMEVMLEVERLRESKRAVREEVFGALVQTVDRATGIPTLRKKGT